MIRSATEEARGSFPRRESFMDCQGGIREFVIDFVRSDDDRFLQAVEVTDDEGRYEFTAMSESDPYIALGKLRQTIRRELSTRYLQGGADRLELAHDKIKGRIAYDGIAVDGRFVSFDEFLKLLQTYEGFHFALQIIDPADL